MGGRGSAGASAKPTGRSRFGSMKSIDNYDSGKLQKQELAKKLPTYGGKTQESYIEYVKKQTGIDLSQVRDTYFDTRKGFNIDARKASPNELNTVKRLARTYPGGYDVSFSDNGQHRIYIEVKRKKIK